MDILVRSWQDLGTILAKILSRSCHGIHFAMVRSYQDRHVSKINLDKKPKMAKKILLRSLRWPKMTFSPISFVKKIMNGQKAVYVGSHFSGLGSKTTDLWNKDSDLWNKI